MRYLTVSLIGFIVCLWALSVPAVSLDVQLHPNWKVIAGSDIIVVGKLSANPRVQKALSRTNPVEEYLEIEIEVTKTLKGSRSGRIPVRYYASDKPNYGPVAKELFDLLGKSALVYLTYAEGNYYFSDGDAAISPLEKLPKDEMQSLMQELARQQTLLDNWTPLEKSPYYKDIKVLIDAIALGDESALIVLEEIGVKAVPAIVSYLDDKRPYPHRGLSLQNKSPDAFEAIRHYGPELMVDAMAAILNQITGERFGSIYNGADEIERQYAIDGWRIYVMTEPTLKEIAK